MKKWIKLIGFSFLVIFLLLVIVLAVPFKERPIQELESSMLLGYYQLGRFEDRLIVFENGSVLLAGGGDVEGDFFYTTLSNSELKTINDFIQNKQYKVKRKSNLDVTKGYSVFNQLFIKINGKTIVIEEDIVIYPTINRLLEVRHLNKA
ncbi:MAG TPA: hypothetical protein VJI98_06615 [Candidatus Nanoarchaeia archaeon]|nr:hypothetical protein [Candidatus Nanoarchaeia archaeon]